MMKPYRQEGREVRGSEAGEGEEIAE